MDGQKDGRTEGWTDRRMKGRRMDTLNDQRTEGWTDQRLNGRKDGRTEG